MSKYRNDIIKIESDFITTKNENKKPPVTEVRVNNVKEIGKQYISYWREYPDLFIDQIKGEDSKFNFFFYQRMFLRAAMRHQYFFGCFPRAYSKSFLSVLLMIVKCILYPNFKGFIVSGGSEQAAKIATEKTQELFDLIPALKNEIVEGRGTKCSKMSKDEFVLYFKNGSRFDVRAAIQSSRGGRAHGGLMDEVILIDEQNFNEVIVPLMNVSRPSANGKIDPNDPTNKSQIFITSAGYKNHFAYQKLIQLLVWQIVKPEKAFVMGGTWRIPVKMGLLDKNFVNEIKADGTFNEDSFEREYESKWSGEAEGSYFSLDAFERNRKINKAELEPRKKLSGGGDAGEYYLGVDVGRFGDQTVITVVRNQPVKGEVGIKKLVNIKVIESQHFGVQADEVKRQVLKWNPTKVVLDANGVGAGLVDFLVIPSTDQETGQELPALGVINDDDRKYKNIENHGNIIPKILYLVKADPKLNKEGYTNLLTQMGSNKIQFLINEREAKDKLPQHIKQSGDLAIKEYLKPYVLTSILENELMNLTQSDTSEQFKLVQMNKSTGKDKVSSLMYALYMIKQDEDKERNRKKKNLGDFMFFG